MEMPKIPKKLAIKEDQLPLELVRFYFLSPCQGLMERLDTNVVLGDGGFVFALEKRGYVKAGPWTPEATVEYPEAGKGANTRSKVMEPNVWGRPR